MLKVRTTATIVLCCYEYEHENIFQRFARSSYGKKKEDAHSSHDIPQCFYSSVCDVNNLVAPLMSRFTKISVLI